MEFEWFGLHKLLRRVVLEGVVVNDEPLRVGAGAGGYFEPVDLVVLKVKLPGKGAVPVVPGSSWKGVFRSTAYSIALVEGLKVCEGLPNATCMQGNEFEYVERAGEGLSKKLEMLVKADGVKACLLCLIFGSPSLASHVYFGESYPLDGYALGYRTCVAISRRTGAAYRGMLFTVEYVEPGCKWSFRLVAENLPNYALGLLAEVIEHISSGLVKVGGLKSRGFGRVHFEDLKLRVYSPKPEEYGVYAGVLKPLDPVDSEVRWTGSSMVAEGEDACRVLEELRGAWRRGLDALKRVSKEGWRWEVVLGGVQAGEGKPS